ncbi:LOW QUALITY PROTEIN: uncharacterized protein ACIGJ3_006218 [Trichechus inunguis]
MPRGQKSKLRAREKRRQARGDAHTVQGTQATAAEEEGSPSSSSPAFGGPPQSSPAACIPQGPQRAPSTTTAAAGASGTRAGRGAKSHGEGAPSSSEAPAPTERSQRDPLTRRVIMLLQFLLYKYKMKEPITKGEMMKTVNRRYKEHFPEILRRASEHMELVFGLDLKEADSKGQSYALVSKLEITKEENMIGGRGLPKNGLLLSLLGMIYTNGNRATEEEMWEFLNMLGIYDGRKHFIFGEPRKFLTKDLVQEKYLEYRQVPNSDPPCYEFLWGPRAQAEASKTKILEFLAKINDTDPSDSEAVYEEIWRMRKGELQAENGLGPVLLPGPGLLSGGLKRTTGAVKDPKAVPSKNLAEVTVVKAKEASLVIMPRGQKSKLRAREKRRQARGDAHGVQEASESPINHHYCCRCFRHKSWRVIMLLQFLPHKYEMKEPITKGEMMKINRMYKEHFPEFLRGASKHMELVFGLDLKEADSKGQSYALVSKLETTKEEHMICGRGFPKNGLLMSLLGMIYMNGNQATEEKMWEFLNMLGIYDGRRHFIFGEPRKFLTKDWCSKSTWSTGRCPILILHATNSCGVPEPKLKPARQKSWRFWPRAMILTTVTPKSCMKKFGEMRKGELQAENGLGPRGPIEPIFAVDSRRPPNSVRPDVTYPDSLPSATEVPEVMPRSQKSNLCVRKKCQQNQCETKVLRGTQSMATAEALPSSSTPRFRCTTQRKPSAKSCSTLQGHQRALFTPTSPGASFTRSYQGANNKDEKRQSSSQDKPSTIRSRRDPVTKKVGTLVEFLLQTYKMKKLIMKQDMLKIVNKKYKNRFLELLRRASFSMEVVFGIELKEIDSIKHTYALISKMDLPNNGMLSRGRGLPKTGLLMTLLGMIFMKGNCASEEKIWEFLNKMRIFAGKRHFIFGEPRKLITQDFVKLKYLEYRQVPNSDPPGYEFLWGPRAKAETTKMKVLEFLAKINDTVPSAFPSRYEEALRDEEKRAGATVPDRAGPTALANAVHAPAPDPATPPMLSEV